MMRWIPILLMAAICGCARPRESLWEKHGLLGELGQPRLREVLNYMHTRGVADAAEASVFELSFWGMYHEPGWEDEPRKPRFEGATLQYKEMPIVVAVSVVKPAQWDEPDELKIVPTRPAEAADPTGATILVKGRRWSVGFTMKGSNEPLSQELTEMLTVFVREYLAGMTRPE